MTKTVPPKSSPPADWQTGQPSEPFELKPPLARALDSLVVSLDEELVRYRYARRGQGAVPPPRRTAFRQRRKALDLIDVKATASSKGPDQAEETSASANASTDTPQGVAPTASEVPPPPSAHPQLGSSLSISSGDAQGATPMPPLQPIGGAIAPYTAIPEDYLETTEALLRSEYEGYDDESQEPEYEPSLLNRLSTPLGVGALLLVLVGSGGLGYLVANPKAVNHLWNHPAIQAMRGKSGENRVAGVDDTDVPGVDGLSPNLAADEFADLDLSTLSTLPNQNARPTPDVFKDLNGDGITPPDATANGAGSSPTPQAGATPGAAAPASPATPPQIAINRPTVAVPSPAANRPAATPARPAASAAPRTTAPATPAANPQASRAPQVATAPAPAPAPTAPATPQALPPVQAAAPAPLRAAATPTAPSADPNYYVVTNYTGDQSLANVRNVVGDAYVRNFPTGARIQMGAFQQENSAQEMVQQLENSGISAEVYEMK